MTAQSAKPFVNRTNAREMAQALSLLSLDTEMLSREVLTEQERRKNGNSRVTRLPDTMVPSRPALKVRFARLRMPILQSAGGRTTMLICGCAENGFRFRALPTRDV